MITLVSGTNRKNSTSERFARLYFDLLKDHDECLFFDLVNLPSELLMDSGSTYENIEAVKEIQENYFHPADKFIFIIPEYNGSFPGILKLLIDVLDPAVFKNKKAGLIGIATGRAGNLRGMDHLASVLMHMRCIVHPFMLPISRVHLEIDLNNTFSPATSKIVNSHIDAFISF
jgi:chromate reductase